MTEEEQQRKAPAANTVIFGLFCLDMLGIYGWSCWQAHRTTERVQDGILAAMEAKPAREEAQPDGEV